MGRQAIHVPRKAKGPFSLGRLLGLCINSATPYALGILKPLKENGWTCNSVQKKKDFGRLVDAFGKLKSSMKSWEIPTRFKTIKQLLVDLEKTDFATMDVTSMRDLYIESKSLQSLLDSKKTQEEFVELCLKTFDEGLPSGESVQVYLNQSSATNRSVPKHEELKAVVQCLIPSSSLFECGSRKAIAERCHDVLSQVNWFHSSSRRNLPALRQNLPLPLPAEEKSSIEIPLEFQPSMNKIFKIIKSVQESRFGDDIGLRAETNRLLDKWFEFSNTLLLTFRRSPDSRPVYLKQHADGIEFAPFRNYTQQDMSQLFKTDYDIIWFFLLSYTMIFGTLNDDPSIEGYKAVFPKNFLNQMIMMLVKEVPPSPTDDFIDTFEKLLNEYFDILLCEYAQEVSQLEQSTSNSTRPFSIKVWLKFPPRK